MIAPLDTAPAAPPMGVSALPALPMRAGHLTIAELVDLYMTQYAGRDTTRTQRLTWWVAQLGSRRLDELGDDEVHVALEGLANRPARCYAGKDAEGRSILRSKGKRPAPATVNRYAAALSSVISWAIKQRIAPKGYVHPCRSIEMRAENNEKTRFLTEDERTRLLAACKASKWPHLYLLVLMAISTGARKGELLGLRGGDIDLEQKVAHVGRTKNGDPKTIPLIPSVVELLKEAKLKPGALVFASSRVPTKAYNFEPRWSEALREAKLRGVTFHTCRHACASFLVQAGATLLEVADLLGHRQLTMTRRYSHLATTHKSALVNRVLGDLR